MIRGTSAPVRPSTHRPAVICAAPGRGRVGRWPPRIGHHLDVRIMVFVRGAVAGGAHRPVAFRWW